MKKLGLVLITVCVGFVCSACSVNLSVNLDGKDKEEVVEKATESSEIAENSFADETASENTIEEEPKAFYGVWCIACKEKSGAERFVSELLSKGFDAKMFVTTDWVNLNPEKFYVVTAGVCTTRGEAEELLESVKRSGYQDAYIKYTGARK